MNSSLPHYRDAAEAAQSDYWKDSFVLPGVPKGPRSFRVDFEVVSTGRILFSPDCWPVGNVPTPHRRITKRWLQTRREGFETSPGKQVQACLRRKDASACVEVIELTAMDGLSPVGFSMVRCANKAVATAITESAADEIARAKGKPVRRFPFCSRPGTALIRCNTNNQYKSYDYRNSSNH